MDFGPEVQAARLQMLRGDRCYLRPVSCFPFVAACVIFALLLVPRPGGCVAFSLRICARYCSLLDALAAICRALKNNKHYLQLLCIVPAKKQSALNSALTIEKWKFCFSKKCKHSRFYYVEVLLWHFSPPSLPSQDILKHIGNIFLFADMWVLDQTEKSKNE